MIKYLPEVKHEDVLFEGEANEYAQIINAYPICHEDCIEILKTVAKLKSCGMSNGYIKERLTYSKSPSEELLEQALYEPMVHRLLQLKKQGDISYVSLLEMMAVELSKAKREVAKKLIEIMNNR